MNGKKNILIVEDDPIIAEDIQASLMEFGYHVFEPVDNASDALKAVRKHRPDLCLLDVHLGDEIDGIQIAAMIKEAYDMPIVFLTAFNDQTTVERIKATNPAGYLVKPVDERNLKTSIEMAFHSFFSTVPDSSISEINKESIFIKIKDRLVNMAYNDIRYFEAYDNYVFLHTDKQKNILSASMKQVEEKLPDSIFFRIHRSYLINLQKVEGISVNHVQIGKDRIPIGKTYRSRLMDRIDML